MADTLFVDKVTTILTAWLQAVNDFCYKGRNYNYVTSTGSANAQVITLPSGSLYSAYTDGDIFVFKAGFSNSGAATLQIVGSSTLAARAIQYNQTALTGGEIAAGSLVQVVALGSTFQLLTNYLNGPTQEYDLTSAAGTNTVTAASQAGATLTTGRLFLLTPANSNTGATTLNITPAGGSALGAKNIFANGVACTGGELVQNVPVLLRYDGTQFQVVSSSYVSIGSAQTITGAKTFSGATVLSGTADLQSQLIISSDISPSSITASQNDYNPASLSTSSVLRLTSNAAWSITGLQGGADGRMIELHNIGSFPLFFPANNASSSAANRFANQFWLSPGDGIWLRYDSTSSLWRALTGPNDLLCPVKVAANSASITFTTTDFSWIVPEGINIRFDNVVLASAGRLEVQISTDGSTYHSTGGDYSHRTSYSISNSATPWTDGGVDVSTSIELNTAAVNITTNAADAAYGWIDIPNPGNGSVTGGINWQIFMVNGGVIYRFIGAGKYNTAGQILGIKLASPAGNISTGNFYARARRSS